jgi:hypothetical protein
MHMPTFMCMECLKPSVYIVTKWPSLLDTEYEHKYRTVFSIIN